MKPSICRILRYRLSEADAVDINTRTENSLHAVEAGTLCPFVVTDVHEFVNRAGEAQTHVSGQAVLNSHAGCYFVTGVTEGDGQGQWRWPNMSPPVFNPPPDRHPPPLDYKGRKR